MRANLQKWDTLGVSGFPVPFARFGEKEGRKGAEVRGKGAGGRGQKGIRTVTPDFGILLYDHSRFLYKFWFRQRESDNLSLF